MGFRVEGSRKMKSSWWKRVLELSWGEEGKWLRDNLEIQIGDGESVAFWEHRWNGETTLEEVFPRLFRLCTNQRGSIKSMGEWRHGKWEWKIQWHRDLRDREKEHVVNLMTVISNIKVDAEKGDMWRWKADTKGTYTVKSAYKSLLFAAISTDSHRKRPEFSTIWQAPAMYKAKMTAWKLVRGRLATCNNLVRRQVNIPTTEKVCVLCKSMPESINHLFFTCRKSFELWTDLTRWVRKQTTMIYSPKEHLLAFVNLGDKGDNKFLSGLWLCTIWVLWKWRNQCKFNNENWNNEKATAEVKARLWGWKSVYNIPVPCTDFRAWFHEVNLLG